MFKDEKELQVGLAECLKHTTLTEGEKIRALEEVRLKKAADHMLNLLQRRGQIDNWADGTIRRWCDAQLEEVWENFFDKLYHSIQ